VVPCFMEKAKRSLRFWNKTRNRQR
jgi:hypothetical protein